MDAIGGFFLELFMEIIGDVLFESSIELSRSKYVPKWLRIMAVTVIIGFFGGLLLLIIGEVSGNRTLLLVICIIIAAIWLFFVIKTLTLKTKRYEYVTLDDNSVFKGKRTYIGWITGSLKLKNNISYGLYKNKEITVIFSRTVDFPKKEQIAIIEDKELQILNELYNITEETLNPLINRARSELVKKLKSNDNGYSNVKSIVLKKVLYVKTPYEYIVYYYFKDEKTGNKIKIKETIA